jgi:hypothetical protein
MEGNHDEKPIYLFDNKFQVRSWVVSNSWQERAPEMLKDYCVPDYFKEDVFEHMTNEDRPDYRQVLFPHLTGEVVPLWPWKIWIPSPPGPSQDLCLERSH